MALKDLLVHLDQGKAGDARASFACSLAAAHNAHLVGLHVIESPLIGGYLAPTVSGYIETATIEAMLQEYRAEAEKVAAEIERKFRDLVQREGISGEWRCVEGHIGDLTTLHARYADLTILGQIDPENPPIGSDANLPEDVLLGSGRPTLITPYTAAYKSVGDTVLVAWNVTREAARAVNDALPFLARAGKVTVLSVNPQKGIAGEGDLPAADMALHLARHGVKAEAAHMVATDIDVGDVLLSRAADLGADLIVMGAYGHSRTRELILGGATRDLLRHMTVPVLMSH